jgi:maleylacetate reductase
MMSFVYTAPATHVLFGSGTLSALPDEIRRMGCSRAIILSTPQQQEQASQLALRLGDMAIAKFCRATMHTPVEVTEAAVAVVAAARADVIISLGGGSTTGLGKAIALRTNLPQIAIPTTYAGSEATPILGETRDGHKITQTNPKVLPDVILYDVDLTLALPIGLTVTSGLNAIAHAVEALYARDANPVISLRAEDAIRKLAGALPRLVAEPSDPAARGDALYGAWACGACLGAVGMSLHHKLCHVLGGSFGLDHASTNAVILPHAVAYNSGSAPDAMAAIGRALDCSDAAGGLFDLSARLGAPSTLAELGFRQEDLDRAAALAVANAYWNPRPVALHLIRALLDDAFFGRRPGSTDVMAA